MSIMTITAEQARVEAAGYLLSRLGDFLWADDPAFDAELGQWRVPIHSRALPDTDVLGIIAVDGAGKVASAPSAAEIQQTYEILRQAGHQPPRRGDRPEDFIDGTPELTADDIAALTAQDEMLRHACSDLLLSASELSLNANISVKAAGYAHYSLSRYGLGHDLWVGEPTYDVHRKVWIASLHSYALPENIEVGRMLLSASGRILEAPTRYEIRDALDGHLQQEGAPPAADRSRQPYATKNIAENKTETKPAANEQIIEALAADNVFAGACHDLMKALANPAYRETVLQTIAAFAVAPQTESNE